MGLTLRKTTLFSITGYCDADWGKDTDGCKSQTGYLIYVGESLIAWTSRKQNTVDRSSTELEYRAIVAAVTELEWVRNLLLELGIKVQLPMTLRSDNLGATFVTSNLVCHTKLKYVAIDLKYVQEKAEAGTISMSHIPGIHQKPDILTKALKLVSFIDQRRNLVRELSQD